MGQRAPAYRFRERSRRRVAHALHPFKAVAPTIIFHRSIRRNLMSHATTAMVTWVGPFWANAWVNLSVPKFTGTPELALGPRPPETTRTRCLYDQLRRAMLRGRLKRGMRLPATRDFAGHMGYRAAWWSTSSSRCEPKDTWWAGVGSGTCVSDQLPEDLLQVAPAQSGALAVILGAFVLCWSAYQCLRCS